MLCHFLNGADAHGGERIGHAKFLRGAAGFDFPIGMLHAAKADRPQRHGHGHVLAHHFGFHRAVVDVAGHALAELVFLEGLGVIDIGACRVGPRVAIIVKHPGHAGLVNLAQVFNTGDFGGVHLGLLLEIGRGALFCPPWTVLRKVVSLVKSSHCRVVSRHAENARG